MARLLAIIRREYVQRVRTRFFLLATVLGPLLMLGFTVVPALIFQINAGGPTRVAVVDETGRMYERVREALLRAPEEESDAAGENADASARAPETRGAVGKTPVDFDFVVEQVAPAGRTPADVQRELNERVRRNELDAYVVLPPDVLQTGHAEYYARNLGDEFTAGQIKRRLSEAISEQRLLDRGVNLDFVHDSARAINLTTRRAGADGASGEARGSFGLAFGIGFFIYITILLYGQVILGAVVEEKATRLTELLFSSVHTNTLMLGKLIGVSLVALTQFTIWAVAFLLLMLYGASTLASSNIHLPAVAPSLVIYAGLFFLMGYFLYATIYLLLGAMVTTTQEGGQLSMPVVFMLAASLWLAVPVIRSPTSTFAQVVSLIPFSAPITMMARIVAEPPPMWQIVLSLGIGFGTVALLIWLAARVYRIGMLMYGKRASIPEMLRWARMK
ncbi:MAG TPA: ABC transporter permease [Pyrinomonadaceae bacterium]|jgi:ABC-2 type transport system permease protein